MHRDLKDRGFEVLAFPCNQFGAQEPGSPEEIKQFVTQYNVEFPLFEKCDVNGDNCHDLYTFLRARSDLNGGNIAWNFAKFLVNKQGEVFKHYTPQTDPSSMTGDIQSLL